MCPKCGADQKDAPPQPTSPVVLHAARRAKRDEFADPDVFDRNREDEDVATGRARGPRRQARRRRRGAPPRRGQDARGRRGFRRRILSAPAPTRARALRPVFVAIGLGANVGNTRRAFRFAARRSSVPFLRNPQIFTPLPNIPRRRPIRSARLPQRRHRADGPRLSAQALLTLLRKSEISAGRKRGGAAKRALAPWTSTFSSTETSGSRRERLTVPHPRMTRRLFVLVPLADVAPRRVVPGTGKTVARFLAEARRRSTESVRRARKASF